MIGAKYLNKSDHPNLVSGVEYTLRQLHDLTGINRGSLWRNLRRGSEVINISLSGKQVPKAEDNERELALKAALKKVSGRWV